jgi:hypothetical protein
MGFIFGDGYISLQKNGRAIIGFNGKYSDLKAIREDLKKIGFNPSSIYQRKRKHKIKTHYKDYEFETLENSFKVSSFAWRRFNCFGSAFWYKSKSILPNTKMDVGLSALAKTFIFGRFVWSRAFQTKNF